MANILRRREPSETSSALGRWEPLRGLGALDPFSSMREMMREMMRDMTGWGSPLDTGLAGAELAFIPRVDIRENPTNYTIDVEVPGAKPEKLDVSVSEGRLILRGEVEEEHEEGERVHTYERMYGQFARSFMLPEGVDTEHVKAELREGVLCITLPKRQGSEAKRVPIEVSQGQRQGQGQTQAPPQAEGHQAETSAQQVKVEKKAA